MEREFVDTSESTSKRIAKQKDELLKLLGSMPNVSAVCSKVGVARSTFHRWMSEDLAFREDVYHAKQLGKSLINDKAYNNVISGIEQKDPGMTRYWLSHNHPDFSNKPILEPWEAERIIRERDYLWLTVGGRLAAGAARIFEAFFTHQRREERKNLLMRVFGGDHD